MFSQDELLKISVLECVAMVERLVIVLRMQENQFFSILFLNKNIFVIIAPLHKREEENQDRLRKMGWDKQ